MIILGIDPGFSFTGFSIIREEKNRVFMTDYGFLRLNPKDSLAKRIALFYHIITEKITAYQVTDIALETPFLGKNAQNFLKLGYLRGIVYLLVEHHNLSIHEFSPREVKRAVTGFGGADKDQVARVVMQLFPRMAESHKSDVTDAIAIGLCGLWHGYRKSIQ